MIPMAALPACRSLNCSRRTETLPLWRPRSIASRGSHQPVNRLRADIEPGCDLLQRAVECRELRHFGEIDPLPWSTALIGFTGCHMGSF